AGDPSARRRFAREGRAAARLTGEPTVVAVHDVGEWAGRPYLVMEHLPGGSLAEACRAGPPSLGAALAWLADAARALDAAHAAGVVHRDVTPANLLIDERGGVKVADFGIARVLEQAGGETGTGTVLG